MRRHLLYPWAHWGLDNIRHSVASEERRWPVAPASFLSFDVPDGCARKTISLAAESGVVLTPAGSSFPNGFDPNDRNIRIAPTFPQLSQIQEAIEIIVSCVELVAIQEQLKKLQQS